MWYFLYNNFQIDIDNNNAAIKYQNMFKIMLDYKYSNDHDSLYNRLYMYFYVGIGKWLII